MNDIRALIEKLDQINESAEVNKLIKDVVDKLPPNANIDTIENSLYSTVQFVRNQLQSRDSDSFFQGVQRGAMRLFVTKEYITRQFLGMTAEKLKLPGLYSMPMGDGFIYSTKDQGGSYKSARFGGLENDIALYKAGYVTKEKAEELRIKNPDRPEFKEPPGPARIDDPRRDTGSYRGGSSSGGGTDASASSNVAQAPGAAQPAANDAAKRQSVEQRAGVKYGDGVSLDIPFSKTLPEFKSATELKVVDGKVVAVDKDGKVLGTWDGERRWQAAPQGAVASPVADPASVASADQPGSGSGAGSGGSATADQPGSGGSGGGGSGGGGNADPIGDIARGGADTNAEPAAVGNNLKGFLDKGHKSLYKLRRQFPDAVGEVQTFLRDRMGFDLPNNKEYNRATILAVQNFQRGVNLKPDGDVGIDTATRMQDFDRDIKSIQQLVAALDESIIQVTYKSAISQLLERELSSDELRRLQGLVLKYRKLVKYAPNLKPEFKTALVRGAQAAGVDMSTPRRRKVAKTTK
jgi:hypothetical protein